MQPADSAEGEDVVDRLVAERLAQFREGSPASPEAASATHHELTIAEHDDLLRRLNALDFVDTLVGGITMPDRIGDYRITSLLGRGGMGTVYGAFQESLEREVALKVLSPAFSADPTMRRRFRIEARATASLHHQHIVPIYDFGEAHGLLYFAMEKVDGVSLDQHIARARRDSRALFEPRQAARRFAGVADALAHAHRRRILHRDVKPGNLLVHGDGTLALADFGLSRMLGEASVRSSGRGGFLGTLQYASPEQARSAELTPVSDLYSLGVTMFEAVSGQLPFRAETPEAVLDALLNHEPRRLRALRPDVPADFAAIVEKLLQKEPGDRYPDAEALARDLRHFADGEPVYVRRPSLFVRAWRRVQRRPGLSAAIAAALLLGATTVYAISARIVEQQHARLARYDVLLAEAVRTLADDPGPLSGPGDLLAVLTGKSHEVAPPAAVYAAIERARTLAPELDGAYALRRAYDEPGDSEAERHLRAGRPLLAKRLLDERIKQSVGELATSQRTDQIRLYRLFVARAVACLCDAVGDPSQARADLYVASMFRPGAFAPRVLATIAELAFTRDASSIIDELEARARVGESGALEIAAELLLAATSDVRPRPAQLMRFALGPGQRAALATAAQERLSRTALDDDGERWSGLEFELARMARAAAEARPAQRAELLRAGRMHLAEAVDARAPLQMWGYVFDLLDDEDAPSTSAVAAELRPRACLALLALELRPALLARLQPALESAAEIASARGEPAVAAELRARVRMQLEPARARGLIDAWVAQAHDDPEAYMARFQHCVQQGLVVEAGDAAMNAVQRAPRRRAQAQRIVARLQQAAQQAPAPQASAWLRLSTTFEQAM
jgi:hypothetical protein